MSTAFSCRALGGSNDRMYRASNGAAIRTVGLPWSRSQA